MQRSPSQQCARAEQLRPEQEPKTPQAPHAQASSQVRERDCVPTGHDPHELGAMLTDPYDLAIIWRTIFVVFKRPYTAY